MSEPLLRTRNLAKRFGGLIVTDDVSLDVGTSELHAVIGPNGAGKTTLMTQLTGQLTPDSGSIWFGGRDITRMPTHMRALLGIARSFQITSLFLEMTAADNVALCAQAHAGHSFKFWSRARTDEILRAPARAALAQVGLSARENIPVSKMSHGEQRLVELAMAIAGRPRLLLLDEPMAGLGPEEAARMVMLLRELKQRYAILLVEHDMEAVFALADRITVLLYGRVIATGSPAEIRDNVEVNRAYLGDQHIVGKDADASHA
ncbi:ABC transporter ATP-binding protein [Tardiphaga robiniae]|uniref:ABC transporter ATP-binding protein n=1 Tax=Tardiphaga robiniae TaxID=943830 RepID=A0A7G6U1K2_9BRAD|nr:ABC transporter ATP-binding protein [Tardiphaga robiniae]QND72884.1 ABC transporter ATP-binding protein [Tardiphaga robiniae]